MYLARLSNEKKHLFLDLEIYLSKIDGDFSELEKNIINTHCAEMRIDNNNYETELSYEELLIKLRDDLNLEEKHIIFLELVAVILADNVYHNAEKNMVVRLAEILNISQNNISKAFEIINTIKEGYEESLKFICGQYGERL